MTAALAVVAGTHEPDDSPLPEKVRAALRRDIAAARRAINACVVNEGVTATAARLGVSRSTLQLWRAPGGWLHTTQETQE